MSHDERRSVLHPIEPTELARHGHTEAQRRGRPESESSRGVAPAPLITDLLPARGFSPVARQRSPSRTRSRQRRRQDLRGFDGSPPSGSSMPSTQPDGTYDNRNRAPRRL